jgi:hypothetical protein
MTKKKHYGYVMRMAEMSNSPAFRALNLSEHRALARLEIEHCNHKGKDNGRLPLRVQDCVDFGIHKDTASTALRVLVALGFAVRTFQGYAGKAGRRRASEFGLTYVGIDGKPPTDDWQHILTIEDAERLAKEARADKAIKKVGFRWEKKKRKKRPIQIFRPRNPGVRRPRNPGVTDP